jgi:hypothetical protein
MRYSVAVDGDRNVIFELSAFLYKINSSSFSFAISFVNFLVDWRVLL